MATARTASNPAIHFFVGTVVGTAVGNPAGASVTVIAGVPAGAAFSPVIAKLEKLSVFASKYVNVLLDRIYWIARIKYQITSR